MSLLAFFILSRRNFLRIALIIIYYFARLLKKTSIENIENGTQRGETPQETKTQKIQAQEGQEGQEGQAQAQEVQAQEAQETETQETPSCRTVWPALSPDAGELFTNLAITVINPPNSLVENDSMLL